MRFVFYAIAVLLVGAGLVTLAGAFEMIGAGHTTEELAQGFLVPASLILVGVFFGIWGRAERRFAADANRDPNAAQERIFAPGNDGHDS